MCHDPDDIDEGPHYLPTMFMCPENCQQRSGFLSPGQVINNGTKLKIGQNLSSEFCLSYSCNYEEDEAFWDVEYIACLCSNKTTRYLFSK